MYQAQITLTIGLTGTNASGGGAINEQTAAVVWQGSSSPAIRQSVVLGADEETTTLTPPASPQPLAGYVLILLPVGVDITLNAVGGDDEESTEGYDCGTLGQAVLLPVPNPYDNSITLGAASQCVAEVWWL